MIILIATARDRGEGTRRHSTARLCSAGLRHRLEGTGQADGGCGGAEENLRRLPKCHGRPGTHCLIYLPLFGSRGVEEQVLGVVLIPWPSPPAPPGCRGRSGRLCSCKSCATTRTLFGESGRLAACFPKGIGDYGFVQACLLSLPGSLPVTSRLRTCPSGDKPSPPPLFPWTQPA